MAVHQSALFSNVANISVINLLPNQYVYEISKAEEYVLIITL